MEYNNDISISEDTNYNSIRSRTYYLIFKRTFDYFGALFLLILSSPIMIIISVIIKFSSKGPVLFKQERIGKDGENFIIYKFRTMVVGCPNIPTDEMKNADKYRTKIGEVIRKLSLDELPQLFNILKGEMSFIGPRPMIKEHDYLIKERKQRGIDKLYPGISGLAQINGRDGITDKDKLKFDEKYLEDFGIKMDIKVLIQTILKVLKKEDIIL